MNPAPGDLGGYRGRFAPSPTGPLHFGSLIAAVGSALQARAQGGVWLVRMEDLDPPREVAGAAEAIVDTLAAFGLVSDEPVIYQSTRGPAYTEALERLQAQGLAFGCACTRRELPRGRPYPAYCRNGVPPGRQPRSLRVRVPDETVVIDDGVQGRYSQNLAREVGDFIVRRADGLTAYQLAVVVDDAAQGITEVVRGSDLLDSTPRQRFLQRALGLPLVDYVHLPVAVDADGNKLSKQTFAAPVQAHDPCPALAAALAFLGHPVPRERRHSLAALWDWALAHWDSAHVPRRMSADDWADQGAATSGDRARRHLP